MKFFKSWPVQLILFLMGFLVLNGAFEFAFLKLDREPAVVMTDLRRAKDIQIAFVGNSISRTHIDNAIIEEETGKISFNLSRSALRAPGTYAAASELFRHQQPEVLVWVYDPIPWDESLVVEATMWPFLEDQRNKLVYAWRESQRDGAYLDRFFPWRAYHPDDLKGALENVAWKLDMDGYYDAMVETFRNPVGTAVQCYDGKGYRGIQRDKNETALRTATNYKADRSMDMNLSLENVSFDDMVRLCEEKQCRLIVATAPNLSQQLLGDKRISYMISNMKKRCQENNIPFLNFSYAKPETLADMSGYFFEEGHMVQDGANIYSHALGRTLKKLLDGQDVSHYFYTEEEYAQSKNYILNGWYTESKTDGKITYAADCIYGADVEPQYQFSAVDEAGNETILRPYRRGQKFTCDEAQLEGKTICIKIRNAADLEQEIVTAIKK